MVVDYTYYTHGFIVKIQPSRTHTLPSGKICMLRPETSIVEKIVA
jgi:hypothetical protein